MVSNGALLAAGAGLKGIAGVAQGIGQARAAKQLFTDADAAELARLERLRRAGQLGLSERERAGLEARAAGQISAMEQGDQAAAFQQQAANASLGGATSTRDVFLAKLAEQDKVTAAKRDTGAAIAQVDEQRRQEHIARIKQLQDMRAQRRMGRIQGITNAITGGLAAAGEGAVSVATMREAAKVPPGLSNEDLFQMLSTLNQGTNGATTAPAPYSNRI